MSAGVGCSSGGRRVSAGCFDPTFFVFRRELKPDEFQTMRILTTPEMREVDRLTTERYGVPSAVLMENAGRSVAQFIQRRFSELEPRTIFVLCGKGNNGGGGFLVARRPSRVGGQAAAVLVCA